MDTLQAIKRILQEEIEDCRQLLELLQKEKIHLMKLELEGVEAIVKSKDILVLKLRLLEEERVRLVDQFRVERPECFLETEKDFQKINLKKLAELTGERDLLDMRSKLISLSQSIKEMNEFNKAMIERTLDFIKKSHPLLPLETSSLPGSEKGRVISRAT